MSSPASMPPILQGSQRHRQTQPVLGERRLSLCCGGEEGRWDGSREGEKPSVGGERRGMGGKEWWEGQWERGKRERREERVGGTEGEEGVVGREGW